MKKYFLAVGIRRPVICLLNNVYKNKLIKCRLLIYIDTVHKADDIGSKKNQNNNL